MNETEARKYLPAFADGELDVEQNLRVLEHMAMNPEATRRVMHQQQLRQAVDRAMQDPTATAPDSLRESIEQLAAQTPITPTSTPPEAAPAQEPSHHDTPRQAPTLGWIGRWVPAAVAAVLLISATALFYQFNPTATASPVSDARYAVFVNRHLGCSRMIEKLMHMERFAQNLEALPESLAAYLGDQPTPGLDLASIGYTFYAVGQCNAPGGQSVHLVYHHKDHPDGQNALSLWIRRYTGSPAIKPDQPYLVAPSGTPSPMIVWRRGGMIYYLIGDSLGSVGTASQLLRLTS